MIFSRKLDVLFLIALVCFAFESQAQTIRIRVHNGNKAVQISGRDMKVAGKPIGDFTASRLEENGEDIWKLSEKSSSAAERAIAATLTESGSATAKSLPAVRNIPFVSFELMGRDLRVNGQHFPSPITFLGGAKDKVNVVVTLPLEDYVAGVVAGEMPPSWPMEALMAQAVASRSYVLAQLSSQSQQLFDTDSSQFNQVFKYISGDEGVIARVREAVKRTQGTVLTDKKGNPLWAYYHADCGGHTEEPDAVWSNRQFYGTASDANCPAKPNTNWEAEVSLPLLNKKLLPVLETKKKIVGVDVGEKTKSGRIKNMIVKLSDGSVEKIRSNQFRQQLGFQWIKSTLFGIDQKGSTLHLTGRGFGHGVGLCQWGSKELAKKGKSYLAILKTYYPAAKIEKGRQLP